MKKFIAIYSIPASALEQMGTPTPEQMKATMDEWMKWAEKNGKSIVDLGAPLGKTKRITATGATDTKNELTGYTIVQGESLDAVAKLFADNPQFKLAEGASIELMECLEVPGM
jgi:YCII-related domain